MNGNENNYTLSHMFVTLDVMLSVHSGSPNKYSSYHTIHNSPFDKMFLIM